MFISRIKLVNWKNFKNVDISLTERNFIVGANASGKSNFLDVIRFLRDIVKQAGGLQYAVEQRDGVSKIKCLAGRQIRGVEILVQLSESTAERRPLWEYTLSFRHAGGGIFKNQAIIMEEKVVDLLLNKTLIHRRDNKNEDKETLKFTFLEQPNANSGFRDIYYFFQETQYLHIVPQLIRDANSYLLAANKEDFFGRNLLERMNKTNKKTRESYLNRINEFLKIAVPQLQNITLVPDDKGVPHLEATYIHWRAKGAKQQEKQFSDGTLRLIGFMWALLDGQEAILLEEPELYLHTAIVKQLPEFIYKMQRRKGKVRQVFVSTHSYELLSNEGIGGDETIVLIPSPEGTKVQKASDMEDIRRYLDSGISIAETVIPKIAPRNIQQILNF